MTTFSVKGCRRRRCSPHTAPYALLVIADVERHSQQGSLERGKRLGGGERRPPCHLSYNAPALQKRMSNSPLIFLGIEASANKCAVGIVRSDGSILSNPRKTCVLCSLARDAAAMQLSLSWPLPPDTSRHQALVSCPARRRRTTSKSSWASFSKLSRRRPCSRTSLTVYATPKARAWVGHS